MARLFKMIVTEIDTETHEEKEVLSDTYTGFTLSAKCDDNKAAEVVMHDTVMDMATRLAQGKHTRSAVRLANVLMAMKRDDAENAETDLLRAFMEG
jgi:hypothetical protein